MITRAFWQLLVMVSAATFAAAAARADIYTWVDRSGLTHVSNEPPPEGVRGLQVTRAAPRDPAREAALRDAARNAELRALNERVMQMQAELEQSRRETAAAIAARPPVQPAPPPPVPYVIVVPPAPAQPAPSGGCDYWGNCGLGFWPGFYSPGVVIVHDRHGHRHRLRHGHRFDYGTGGIPRLPQWPSPVPIVRNWPK